MTARIDASRRGPEPAQCRSDFPAEAAKKSAPPPNRRKKQRLSSGRRFHSTARSRRKLRHKAECALLLVTQGGPVVAAGHMPKDADFNCGEKNGTTPVDAYPKTPAACGAIDMWGNCREWTSTPLSLPGNTERGKTVMAVKGGSRKSSRTSCRTEQKGEGRESSAVSDDVGFRIIRVN